MALITATNIFDFVEFDSHYWLKDVLDGERKGGPAGLMNDSLPRLKQAGSG